MEGFNTSIAMPISYPFLRGVGSSGSGGGGGGGGATARAVSPCMDSRIWSRLPQRLIDHVIVFLPPPAFFRARSVFSEPRFLRSPCLVESRGKLILVAAVEKSKLNVPKSLRLWGLQSCGTTWVETERMPQQLYAQFEDIENGRGFNCVGHGEFIIIMIRGSEKALLFDISKKRWLWVPPCPFIGCGVELHGFAYEPRLATPVTGLLDQLALPFQSFNG